MRRVLGVLLVGAGLALLFGALSRQPDLWRRWLAPVGTLVAGIEWVRADEALRAGENWRAYGHAEAALRWSDQDSAGWIYYAHNLLFHEARSTRELKAGEREAYARAGLEVLERARVRLSDPGEILIYEGAVWAGWAGLPEDLRPIPCSSAEAWQTAGRRFASARAHGHPQAAALQAAAEEQYSHAGGADR